MQIERRTKLSVEQFWKEFLIPNKPVCIVDLTENWNCWKDFRLANNDLLNFRFLNEKFGHFSVPVVDCLKQKDYNNAVVEKWSFSSYAEYVKNNKNTRKQEKEHNISNENNVIMEKRNNSLYYLKDWHFVSDVFQSSRYVPYETPSIFKDDWLNNSVGKLDWGTERGMDDDYKFLYFGVEGTKSFLHVDVFRSYSWSTNIVGRKKWIFVSPEDVSNVFGTESESIIDVDSISDQSIKEKIFKYAIIFIQNAGETIFVPSGWMHQVENLDDCLSFNHNWSNAANLVSFWTFLESETKKVEYSISDCKETCIDEKEWNGLVQKVLLSNIGIDLEKFLKYIELNVKDKLESEKNEENLNFTIKEVRKVVEKMPEYCIEIERLLLMKKEK
jgi:hypothetical protein